jgi:hypothetical protein
MTSDLLIKNRLGPLDTKKTILYQMRLRLNSINLKLNKSTVKPVLTATSKQRPPVYNGQLEPQFSKIL